MTEEHAGAAAATLPAEETRAEESTRTRKLPPYNVIVVNDEDHTFDYVIEMLCKLFRHDVDTAKRMTWQIHTTGRSIVLTTHKEMAELKRDQVLAYGPDHRLKKSKCSMRCYIEPAPGA
jgi:ATP-dependent Clp protease adaptor protein ClpS